MCYNLPMPEQTIHYAAVPLSGFRSLETGGYRMTIAVNDADRSGDFVNLARMRVDRYMDNPVVKWLHGKGGITTPIGRTTNLNWVNREKSADWEFAPGDADAAKIKNLYDRGFIRAASIGWVDLPPGDPMYDTELIEWSLADIPGDPDAVRSLTQDLMADILTSNTSAPHTRAAAPEGTRMTPEEMESMRGMIDEAVKKRMGMDDDKEHMRSLTLTVDDIVAATSKTVDAALNARDEANAKTAEAEAEKAKLQADMTQQANTRAQLLVQTHGLIPDGRVLNDMTNREIMLVMVGDELPDAASRSDDYLAATVDGIVKRRAAASQSYGVPNVGTGANLPNNPPGIMDRAQFDAALRTRSISPEVARTRSMQEQDAQYQDAYTKAGGR